MLKDAIATALERVTPAMLDFAAGASAGRLIDGSDARDGAYLDRWCAEFPIGVVAHLVGVDDPEFDALVSAARTLAACFGPTPPSDAVVRAPGAAETLAELAASARAQPRGLAAQLADIVGPRALPMRWRTRSACSSRRSTLAPQIGARAVAALLDAWPAVLDFATPTT